MPNVSYAWSPAFDVEAGVDGVPQHLEDAGEAVRQVHALEHWPGRRILLQLSKGFSRP
jgi:hypothetical protein